MNTVNPIPLSKIPSHSESSFLRSQRDSDTTSRQWIKNKVVAGQARSYGDNIRMLQQQIDRLRRYSGSDNTAAGMVHKGEWVSTTQYEYQNVVTRGMLGEFIVLGDNPVVGVPPEAGAPSWHCLTSWPANGAWA